jgi:copper(I)-binding protein
MKILILSILLSSFLYAKLDYKNPRIRLMPPGVKISAGFFKVSNSSDKDIKIIGAKADWAKTIELHIHAMEEGVMAMRQVEEFVVPAKGEFELKPKGPHLMIFKIQEELKEGKKFEIELELSNGKSETVEFEVKKF